MYNLEIVYSYIFNSIRRWHLMIKYLYRSYVQSGGRIRAAASILEYSPYKKLIFNALFILFYFFLEFIFHS